MRRVQGIGASAGYAIGKAFVLPNWEWDLDEQVIDVADMAGEYERLYRVINQSKDEIRAIKNDITGLVGQEEKSIFDTHLAILDDPVFMSEIRGIIERQYLVAEAAVKEVMDKFVKMFDLLEDPYMKERAADIKDVGNRLLKHLIGTPDITLPADNRPFILVARELTPSQMAHLNPEHVLAIVSLVGGRDSHAAIMARSMGIPFVLGIENKLDEPIVTGDSLVVDGNAGLVMIDPEESVKQEYAAIRLQWLENQEKLRNLAGVSAVTKDGRKMALNANISSLKELEQAMMFGAEGVGLFRTEFLYMERENLPGEEEQFEVYKSAAQKLGGKPLIIRTFDIGGDKQLNSLMLPEEENPFLGYRAIRISLDRTDMFKTQLRAILRASIYGNVKIMYPMIASLDELLSANEVLAEAKKDLDNEGKAYADSIEVGIMIEVPAAVAIADLLAEEADFFSIGTNDLIQYVLAVDRMNEKISNLYTPYHPAIIRMLRQVIDAAGRTGIPVEVCGETAGNPEALPIWLGLGVHQLSMSVQSLLEVKQRILQVSEQDGVSIFNRIMLCRSSSEIGKLLKQAGEFTIHH